MPGFVREVRVGRYSIHFDSKLLEFGIIVGEVAKFGGANEREVGGVEHEDGPLSLEVFVRHRYELAVVIGGRLEGFDFCVDQGHGLLPREW